MRYPHAFVLVRTAAVAVLIFVGSLQSAWSAPTATLTASVSPTSVGAGTSNGLTFTYTALELTNTNLQLVVPAGSWSAPQINNPTQPGYVLVERGSCVSASASSVAGAGGGPWTILVAVKCPRGRSFSVVYGAGPASAAAATAAGLYTFDSHVKVGPGFIPLPSQPVITVTPGAATSLDLGGLSNAQAGTVQVVTVTALDTYGNVASGYQGLAALTSTDTNASLPAPLGFSAADAGVRTTTVTLKTAGSRQVVVTDTTTASLTDNQTVLVSPGPAAEINVTIPAVATHGEWVALTGWLFFAGGSCFATVVDTFGNALTSFSDGLQWTSSDPAAVLPNDGPIPFNPFCDFVTPGEQTLTVTSSSNPAVAGTLTFPVRGPEAIPDTVTFADPAHNGSPLYTMDVTANDIQTNTSQPFYLLTCAAPPGGCIHKQTIAPASVTQAEMTKDGVLYQVGVVAVTKDGHFLVWDLDPPAGTVPSNSSATLLRCPVSPATEADICRITDPMEIEYGITDTQNVSTATVTLTLETPNTPPINATGSAKVDSSDGRVFVYSTGANSNVPMQAYMSINLNVGTYDLNTNVASTTFEFPISGTTAAVGSMDVLLDGPPPAGQPLIVTVLPPPTIDALGYELTEYDSYFTTVLPLLLKQGASTGYSTRPGWHYNIDSCINTVTGAVIQCP